MKMSMPPTFARSIFAHELSAILDGHSSSIYELSRRPISLEGRKVTALVDSLTSIDRLPALNHGEIMSIVNALRLPNIERFKIYASLIAVGAQRQIRDYLTEDDGRLNLQDCERAWSIAEEVRKVALIWLQRRYDNGDSLFRGPGQGMPPDTLTKINPLQAALDAYDQGSALAALGIENLDKTGGQASLEQAKYSFALAQSLLENLNPALRETEEWHYWYQKTLDMLAIVQDELD